MGQPYQEIPNNMSLEEFLENNFICTDIDKFKSYKLSGKINDMLLHYRNSHDRIYKEKARILKQEIEYLESNQKKKRGPKVKNLGHRTR